jgi:acyl carrier protein
VADMLTVVTRCIERALELELGNEGLDPDRALFGAESDGALGLDSLAALEIVVALETELDIGEIEFSSAAFETARTLAEWLEATTEE